MRSAQTFICCANIIDLSFAIRSVFYVRLEAINHIKINVTTGWLLFCRCVDSLRRVSDEHFQSPSVSSEPCPPLMEVNYTFSDLGQAQAAFMKWNASTFHPLSTDFAPFGFSRQPTAGACRTTIYRRKNTADSGGEDRHRLVQTSFLVPTEN